VAATDGAPTAGRRQEIAPMLKWLVLPMVVFAYLAATVSAAAPRDRDRDQLPDRWERNHHLSTTSPSAKRDPDGDRLNNRRELRLRTHPRRADTDRDRLRDGAEVRRFHTNPRKRDTDGDGFRDRCELRKGTNPRKRGSRPKRRCSKSPQAPPSAPLLPPPGGSPQPTGGWPAASNTGVPAGTPLTPTSGNITISQAGAVIANRDHTGSITVNAPNVTILRTRVDSDAFLAIRSNSTGLVVEDSEITDTDGGLMCHDAIGFGNFTMRRTEVTGCENAADVGEGNVTFADNYVHDLAAPGTGQSQHPAGSPHTDGIQGVNDNTRIINNWIAPGDDATSPIIFDVGGSGRDIWVEDNYLDGRGSSYTLYANRQPSTNVNINRNRMHRASFGYTACVKVAETVTEFNDNRDAITGAGIAPDNGAGGSCSN
jgi:Bacterial TSP3 repeat